LRGGEKRPACGVLKLKPEFGIEGGCSLKSYSEALATTTAATTEGDSAGESSGGIGRIDR
jgi:hypothetical protein